MLDYQKEFVDFMLDNKVLQFGDFTLKSGRKSPFFMNAGLYTSGKALQKLGEFYARAIYDNFGLDFDVLFGPAYKGIPIAVATAMAIYDLYGKEVHYSANRKEMKTHGDKGTTLGDTMNKKCRVLMIEDVTTSGKSIEETYPVVTEHEEVEVIGLIVSLDRQEKGRHSDQSALKEISDRYHMPTSAIVSFSDAVNYIRESNDQISDQQWTAIKEYYEIYGAK